VRDSVDTVSEEGLVHRYVKVRFMRLCFLPRPGMGNCKGSVLSLLAGRAKQQDWKEKKRYERLLLG
jgi:hypothetical protein